MSKTKDPIDTMMEHFEDINEKINFPTHFFGASEDQPKHFSWLHVWCHSKNSATEQTIALEYMTAGEFQVKILQAVTSFFSTDALELVRKGKITDFGMQIGPLLPSGGNLNDELGLEVNYDKK
jgi:hypothetical protein